MVNAQNEGLNGSKKVLGGGKKFLVIVLPLAGIVIGGAAGYYAGHAAGFAEGVETGLEEARERLRRSGRLAEPQERLALEGIIRAIDGRTIEVEAVLQEQHPLQEETFPEIRTVVVTDETELVRRFEVETEVVIDETGQPVQNEQRFEEATVDLDEIKAGDLILFSASHDISFEERIEAERIVLLSGR